MKSIKLTQAQYDELVERKKFLQETAIPENSKEIEKAKEFGDLKENAEYHAAKEQNSKLIQELNETTAKINRASIIKAKNSFDQVDIGHQVTLLFLNENTEKEFTLIGEDGDGIEEVDMNSKLGQAVLGRKVGETFSYEANTPSLGELRFKVKKIN